MKLAASFTMDKSLIILIVVLSAATRTLASEHGAFDETNDVSNEDQPDPDMNEVTLTTYLIFYSCI